MISFANALPLSMSAFTSLNESYTRMVFLSCAAADSATVESECESASTSGATLKPPNMVPSITVANTLSISVQDALPLIMSFKNAAFMYAASSTPAGILC